MSTAQSAAVAALILAALDLVLIIVVMEKTRREWRVWERTAGELRDELAKANAIARTLAAQLGHSSGAARRLQSERDTFAYRVAELEAGAKPLPARENNGRYKSKDPR